MKKTKINVPVCILAAVIFTVLYLILAARPLAKEYQFEPDWTISLSGPVTKNAAGKPLVKFLLGQSLGYFTEDGELAFYKTFPARAAISEHFFTLYNTNATELPLFRPDGEQLCTISAAGFPMLDEDRIFVFLPGGSAFSACDENGRVRWTYENTMPITAFASTKAYVAAGHVNGTINLLNLATGEAELSYEPGGSDYPVILGLDISADGQYIASFSGQNRQRFVLARKEVSQPKIIFHEFLDTDSINRTIVYFCKDGNRVLYNYGEKIGIYDIQRNAKTEIPVSSRIISVQENDTLIFLLGRKERVYTVYIIEKTNTLEGQFSFTADSAFIRTYNDKLFIGKDNSVSRITISRE